MRDFAPAARTRTAFDGVEATPFDPRRSIPGRVPPYGGREREAEPCREPMFSLDGREPTPRVTVEENGALWADLADSTSGDGSYRSRIPRPAAPDVEGRTTVYFNRSLLPSCTFADRFVCLLPALGNTLGVATAAGERELRWSTEENRDFTGD
ncbi:DUF1684 domain-containing protein [Streptomyces sp. WI04-05B]|uniref:DUF1684 domain-containing protein n=1 Tax=Streptomyces TaxID=1883 RepID=UPI0029C094CA|nr:MULTISPECIES: DUF1684 domain-containing protein [unclassified Streptomyces]